MATLVHDDVLDEARLRRRVETLNHLRGNETAVMLGDYLISNAFQLCTSLNDARINYIMGQVTNTICEGELLQLHHRDDFDIEESTYFEIVGRKTGSLIGECCRLGALISGVDPPAPEAMRRFGILLGIVSAARRGTVTDSLITVGALIFYATPAFWFGLMLIVFFSLKLDLLPSSGMETIASGKIGLAYVMDVTNHLILPSVTMALYYLAIYTRLMRASMLEVLSLDFVRTARAKGLAERTVAWKHAARNALLPVVTVAGLQIGHFMGGSVLVETIFGWPGLGRLVFDALMQRDSNLLMGIFLMSSVFVVLMNLFADLLYGMLDPRITHK